MTNPFDLSNRGAIVTGANTGIGQGIALALAEAGADIACVGRTPAEETVAQTRALGRRAERSEEHTSELQSLMRISYAVFCLKKKNQQKHKTNRNTYLNHI